jgi:hypothetical protein
MPHDVSSETGRGGDISTQSGSDGVVFRRKNQKQRQKQRQKQKTNTDRTDLTDLTDKAWG